MSGSFTNTLMDEMKTSEERTAENQQIDEVSNETTLDSNEVPVNSISNPEETSSTGRTRVTFVAHNFLSIHNGFGLNCTVIDQ